MGLLNVLVVLLFYVISTIVTMITFEPFYRHSKVSGYQLQQRQVLLMFLC